MLYFLNFRHSSHLQFLGTSDLNIKYDLSSQCQYFIDLSPKMGILFFQTLSRSFQKAGFV